MIKVIKHGEDYNKMVREAEIHKYRCGGRNKIGGCGCEFTATLADFTYMVVGHGVMDYVGHCPECARMIHDMLDRIE